MHCRRSSDHHNEASNSKGVKCALNRRFRQMDLLNVFELMILYEHYTLHTGRTTQEKNFTYTLWRTYHLQTKTETGTDLPDLTPQWSNLLATSSKIETGE